VPTSGSPGSDASADTLITVGGEAPTVGYGKDLGEGMRLGRYVLLERLGEGGMGVVFAAFDPQLDRKVAVKLLRAARRTTPSGAARMLREAKALASVSHPNVVGVHDVGTYEGGVFIAMEYVEGATLRDWLETPRPWREVVTTMIDAARGLAAVHDNGLVHRDFKPDNVMVDAQGRVRVMDFGLAHAERNHTPAPQRVEPGDDFEPGEHPAIQVSVRDRLTRTGAIRGTPAYMAPEQHLGLPVDARTDQFAFCIALYQALFHQDPFPTANMTELVVAVCEAEPTVPPKSVAVPAWARRVTFRGLLKLPDERFASMHELIDALEQGLGSRRRRQTLVAGGLAVATLGASFAYASRSSTDADCPDATQRLASTWDDDARRRVVTGFEAVPLPVADSMASSVTAGLDDYAEAWTQMYAESCVAHRVLHEIDADVWRRRVACLDQRRRSLRGLIDVLATADADVVVNGLDAVSRLPPIEPCADARPRADATESLDDETQAAVDAIDAVLAQARALETAGSFTRSAALTQEQVAAADALGHAPSRCAGLLQLGRVRALQSQSGPAADAFSRAHLLAIEHKLPRMAAEAAIGSLDAVVGVGHRTTRLEALVGTATAHALAVDDPQIDASLYLAHGRALQAAEKLTDARLKLEQALLAVAAVHGDRSRPVADALLALAQVADHDGLLVEAEAYVERASSIAGALYDQHTPLDYQLALQRGRLHVAHKRYDDAHREYESARKIATALRGPEHADVGVAVSALGRVAFKRKDLPRALELATQSCDLLAKTDAPLATASALTNRGNALGTMGRLDESDESFLGALAAYESRLGSDHPRLGVVLNNLGYSAALRSKRDDARAYYERGIEVQGAAYGVDHIRLELLRRNLADLALQQGRFAEALHQYQRVIDARTALYGPDNPDLAPSLSGVGRALAGLERPKQATAALERAVRLFEQTPKDWRLAQARMALAELIVLEDQARALDLAKLAAERMPADSRLGAWARAFAATPR